MATIRFFLKYTERDKSPIRAIVSYKKQYYVSTGIVIPTKYWNAEKYRCREVREFSDGKHFNNLLDEWEKRLRDVVKSFEAKMAIPTIGQFKKAVDKELNRSSEDDSEESKYLLDFARHYVKTCGKSESVVTAYEVAIKRLEAYEKKMRMKIEYSHLGTELYDSIRSFMMNRTYMKGKVQLKYAKNTVGNTMKNLRLFINESQRAEYHNVTTKGITVEKEETDSIYLSIEELIKIHELNITPELISKKLEDVYNRQNVLSIFLNQNVQKHTHPLQFVF